MQGSSIDCSLSLTCCRMLAGWPAVAGGTATDMQWMARGSSAPSPSFP